SSRRRHTRSKRDWSSDVCSSDLQRMFASGVPCGLSPLGGRLGFHHPTSCVLCPGNKNQHERRCFYPPHRKRSLHAISTRGTANRSEERRVGKGGRVGEREGT